jgi:hypothetical protein
MKRHDIAFEFVEYIPHELEDGKLYISTTYATAVHRCCCGCGSKITTPLAPSEWSLTFDGETVSLNPSIGNWSFPCQSHYWIRRNKITWAGRFSSEQIAAVRRGRVPSDVTPVSAAPEAKSGGGLWSWIKRGFR